jgi:negative regulator of sigma E activity
MRADNTRHIVAAAQHRHEYTRAKAIQALRELETAGGPVTFDAVASAAGVSRSWLYSQADLRAEIERLRASSRPAPGAPVPTRQRASDASLLRRLEAANARNRQLADENRRLRDQLARALGEQRSARSREPAGRHLGSATIGPR